MKRVILTSQSNYSSQWNAFVLNHPHGEVFHLPAMVEVYENTPLYKPFACAVVGGDDEFLGVLVACIQREFKGFLGSFTSRSILMGCPLVKDNDATIGLQLLTFYEQHIAKEVIYSQVRNLYDMSWLRTMISVAYIGVLQTVANYDFENRKTHIKRFKEVNKLSLSTYNRAWEKRRHILIMSFNANLYCILYHYVTQTKARIKNR